MSNYDDIIDLPHHVSQKHPQMSMLDRAAQFSPFAALTGYGDAIDEAARITEAQIELDDSEQQEIDRVLREAYETGSPVEIAHFVPDGRKEGGAYAVTAGKIKKLDTVIHSIVMDNAAVIDVSNIAGASFQSNQEFKL